MRLEFIEEVIVMAGRDPGAQAGLKLAQVKLNRSVIRMPNSAFVIGNMVERKGKGGLLKQKGFLDRALLNKRDSRS